MRRLNRNCDLLHDRKENELLVIQTVRVTHSNMYIFSSQGRESGYNKKIQKVSQIWGIATTTRGDLRGCRWPFDLFANKCYYILSFVVIVHIHFPFSCLLPVVTLAKIKWHEFKYSVVSRSFLLNSVVSHELSRIYRWEIKPENLKPVNSWISC